MEGFDERKQILVARIASDGRFRTTGRTASVTGTSLLGLMRPQPTAQLMKADCGCRSQSNRL
jgi:hypothetical protein